MDPPTETNRQSHQGHSSVFVPKRDKFLSGTCFEMVGAPPPMPDTFDGVSLFCVLRLEKYIFFNISVNFNTVMYKNWYDESDMHYMRRKVAHKRCPRTSRRFTNDFITKSSS